MHVNSIDKCVNVIKHDVPVLDVDGKNSSAFYCGDVLHLTGDEFKNYGGWQRNELAIINEQNSEAVAQALCDKLYQLHDDGVLESDVSDTELRLHLKPRWCQTPSEQIAFNERMLEIRDSRIEAKRKAAAERAEADRIVAEKDALWNSLSAEEKETLLKKKREKEVESLID